MTPLTRLSVGRFLAGVDVRSLPWLERGWRLELPPHAFYVGTC
jgi:hypothetical protein